MGRTKNEKCLESREMARKFAGQFAGVNGGWAEGQAYADSGARTHIGASRNSFIKSQSCLATQNSSVWACLGKFKKCFLDSWPI
jgi:hypothetical protein